MANIQIEIKTRIDRIKANYQNYHNARKIIIEDMLYLEKHKVELKAVTGKTWAEMKTELTGFSKRYFNQLVSNYKFLEQHGKLELFDNTDVKAIEHAKKQNKPELLDDPANLKRPQSGRRSPTIIDAVIMPSPEEKTSHSAPDKPENDAEKNRKAFYQYFKGLVIISEPETIISTFNDLINLAVTGQPKQKSKILKSIEKQIEEQRKKTA